MNAETLLTLEDSIARPEGYAPHFEFSFDMGHYRVKTATTYREIISSLRLRHEVFFEEMLGQSHASGVDVDRFDGLFDHLIIVDQKSDTVIATYRMYSSDWGDDFYTKSEFFMPGLATLKGPILEVGRACVHPNYRKGAVMTMLWRGIAEYLRVSGCQVLMGCGSLKTENLAETVEFTKYFQQRGHYPKQTLCSPRPEYTMPGLEAKVQSTADMSEEKLAEIDAKIPSLLKMYMKMGATVAGLPAWDRDFKCIDFVVLLEMEKLNSVFGKRYKVAGNEES